MQSCAIDARLFVSCNALALESTHALPPPVTGLYQMFTDVHAKV